MIMDITEDNIADTNNALTSATVPTPTDNINKHKTEEEADADEPTDTKHPKIWIRYLSEEECEGNLEELLRAVPERIPRVRHETDSSQSLTLRFYACTNARGLKMGCKVPTPAQGAGWRRKRLGSLVDTLKKSGSMGANGSAGSGSDGKTTITASTTSSSSSSTTSSSWSTRVPIYLNVYDLTPMNGYIYWFGLGIFHSGIEAHGLEYAFGAHDYPTSGVFEVEPRQCPGFTFRKSIMMGSTDTTPQEFRSFIERCADEFSGNSYHLITKNCNHFSNDVCVRLTGREIPGWVNRLAGIGSFCNCLLPESLQLSVVSQSDRLENSQRSLEVRRSLASLFGSETGNTKEPEGESDLLLLASPDGDPQVLMRDHQASKEGT
ncbi:hypothetical protein R1sor_018572 [Riccia sorocarpa]|uniref:PPPDE domain-containing protein n=1 Tax=Riccia sorocarpa TaxID=122646 RepID=A0ABD3IDT3_9MARC